MTLCAHTIIIGHCISPQAQMILTVSFSSLFWFCFTVLVQSQAKALKTPVGFLINGQTQSEAEPC